MPLLSQQRPEPDWTLTTSSPEATTDLGRDLAARLRGGEVILLRGALGAGKTRFVAGLAEGLGIDEPAVSPTYIIMRSYERPDGLGLHHFDFYRLGGDDDLDSLGVEEFVDNRSVVAVEWPDRCPAAFDSPWLELELRDDGDSRRVVRGWWGSARRPDDWPPTAPAI